MIRNLPSRIPNPLQESLYAQLRASIQDGSVSSAGVQAYLQTFRTPPEPSVYVWQAPQTQCLDAELEADVDRICAEQLQQLAGMHHIVGVNEMVAKPHDWASGALFEFEVMGGK